MSLEAIKNIVKTAMKEAHTRRDRDAATAAHAAMAEIVSVERALAVGALVLRGDSHIVPTGRLDEAARIMDAARQAEVLAELAEEET